MAATDVPHAGGKETSCRFPLAGAASPAPISGLRRLVVDNYILDYEIVGKEVRILNVRHGRQLDPYLEEDTDFEAEG